ncbi:hypothetical protein BJ878DRAFT_545564 [Calycina marina]|uniref:BTB domain-containing protein n=1 Tax=Calycina marina TaxID=1763456 RepID=A0A9P8CBP2_9HELO|nr:hypothetical protein BJ878DRAFT_545564 [Calycina marina]
MSTYDNTLNSRPDRPNEITTRSFENPTSMATFLISAHPGTPFLIHKEVACYHSQVFDAVFNSNFIESQT